MGPLLPILSGYAYFSTSFPRIFFGFSFQETFDSYYIILKRRHSLLEFDFSRSPGVESESLFPWLLFFFFFWIRIIFSPFLLETILVFESFPFTHLLILLSMIYDILEPCGSTLNLWRNCCLWVSRIGMFWWRGVRVLPLVSLLRAWALYRALFPILAFRFLFCLFLKNIKLGSKVTTQMCNLTWFIEMVDHL